RREARGLASTPILSDRSADLSANIPLPAFPRVTLPVPSKLRKNSSLPGLQPNEFVRKMRPRVRPFAATGQSGGAETTMAKQWTAALVALLGWSQMALGQMPPMQPWQAPQPKAAGPQAPDGAFAPPGANVSAPQFCSQNS